MICIMFFALCVSVEAQQPKMAKIGLLRAAFLEKEKFIEMLQRELGSFGYVDGKNIAFEFRAADNKLERFPELVDELVRLKVDILITSSTVAALAAKKATATIPIIVMGVTDPVAAGLVDSLARPGGNITGFAYVEFPMLGKWLELLKEMVPSIRRAALMFNPETAPYYPVWLREFKALPQPLAVELVAAPVHNEAEIEAAIVALAGEPAGGLISAPDPFTIGHGGLIMTLAKRHRVPAVYQSRQFAAEGGLTSYGPNTHDIFRRSASYVDRILRGEKPADLPVQAPTKFELVR